MDRISPEDWHLLIEAVVTFLGIAGLYLKLHSGQKATLAAVNETGAKVDAHLSVTNALGASVSANEWAARRALNDAIITDGRSVGTSPPPDVPGTGG